MSFVGSGLHGRECAWVETFSGSMASKQISSREPCKYSLMISDLRICGRSQALARYQILLSINAISQLISSLEEDLRFRLKIQELTITILQLQF